MESANTIQANTGNEWMFLLLSFLLLVGLYFLQKYIYLFDLKLSEMAKSERVKNKKPWSLYTGISLGISVFIFGFFSAHTFSINSWGLFESIVLSIMILIIAGIGIESIQYLGLKFGLIRSFVYLVLTAVYFYAGFISGLLFISLLALIILIYFFRYFKKLLTLQ